jgi:hypothetical protein
MEWGNRKDIAEILRDNRKLQNILYNLRDFQKNKFKNCSRVILFEENILGLDNDLGNPKNVCNLETVLTS